MTANSLTMLAADLLSGKIRVVDLTQTLSPDFPPIVLPPEFGQCWPFRMEEISRYDERGPAWYWNNFSCGEHTGTHFDAPIHWVSGRDLPNNATDTVPVQHLIGSACVIDCSAEAGSNPDFLLTADHVRRWEAVHGQIPPRAWVLMRTDWSKRTDPSEFQNFDETGQHTPGPATDVVRFLVDDRDVMGFGTESIGTDAGQGYHLQPAVSLPLLHARLGSIRPAVSDQFGSAAADRCGNFLRPAQDQERFGKPDQGPGTRAGLIGATAAVPATVSFPAASSRATPRSARDNTGRNGRN